MIELFVVKDASGKVVKGFHSKPEAKLLRDALQKEHGSGIPEAPDKGDHTKWRFHVGYGKDHRLYDRAET